VEVAVYLVNMGLFLQNGIQCGVIGVLKGRNPQVV
jgi:hypothetical protein